MIITTWIFLNCKSSLIPAKEHKHTLKSDLRIEITERMLLQTLGITIVLLSLFVVVLRSASQSEYVNHIIFSILVDLSVYCR